MSETLIQVGVWLKDRPLLCVSLSAAIALSVLAWRHRKKLRSQLAGAWVWTKEQDDLWTWIVVLSALLLLYLWFVPNDWKPLWLQDFKGNLVGETIGGIIFLIVGAVLQTKIDRLLKRTHELQKDTHGMQADVRNVQNETHGVVEETQKVQRDMRGVVEETQKVQRDMHGVQYEMHRVQVETRDLVEWQSLPPDEKDLFVEFHRFLWRESHHDIVLLDQTSPYHPHGLQYTIAPVKDPSGKPAVLLTEMQGRYYVVRVQGPAHALVLSPNELQDYQDAPIHTAEPYFCSFYNGSWHIGRDALSGRNWHRFELSGKVGQMERVISASEFLQLPLVPKGAKEIRDMIVDADGAEVPGFGGGSRVRIYREPSGGILVQPSHTAPAKSAYVQINDRTGSKQLVIQNLEGYFTGDARPRFLKLIEKTVEATGYEFLPVHGWE